MDEKTLLEYLKTGDERAFTALYRIYWREVYSFCTLYLNSRDAAQEVVQEVFVKLWDSRATVDQNQNFRGFLFIITRNLIFNRYRKEVNAVRFRTTMLAAMKDELYSMEDELERANMREYLDRLIEKLPEKRQTVFRMKCDENLTYKEIAEQLGITERMVERHLYLTMKFLKENVSYAAIFMLMTNG